VEDGNDKTLVLNFRLLSCVRRVEGAAWEAGLEVVAQSVCATNSANGATARPHVRAVSDSHNNFRQDRIADSSGVYAKWDERSPVDVSRPDGRFQNSFPPRVESNIETHGDKYSVVTGESREKG
jgi:hypothetical protein